MKTGEIVIYQNTEGSMKMDLRLEEGNVRLVHNQYISLFCKVWGLIAGQLGRIKPEMMFLIAVLTNIFANIFAVIKNYPTFVSNNTCHASHLNSAPGQVFAFNEFSHFRLFTPNTYALQ